MFPLNPDSDMFSEDELFLLSNTLSIAQGIEIEKEIPRKARKKFREALHDLLDVLDEGLYPEFTPLESFACLSSVVSIQMLIEEGDLWNPESKAAKEMGMNQISPEEQNLIAGMLAALKTKFEYILSQLEPNN